MRKLPGVALAVLLGNVGLAAPPQGSPELQQCLQHLRPGERERAARVLGPLEELPFYRFDLSVDPARRSASGTLQIDAPVRAIADDELYLRSTPNTRSTQVTLSDVQVDGHSARVVLSERSSWRVARHADPASLRVHLSAHLSARVPLAPRDSDGLGILSALGGKKGQDNGDFGAFAASDDFVSLVGILPQLPPLVDGKPSPGPSGIGDFALYEPSNVLATITVPAGWSVEATGAAVGQETTADGRTRFSFAAAAVRDFPVFVSKGFTSAFTQVNGVRVESYFAPTDAEAGKEVLASAAAALGELEKRLGPIPYATVRVVEAPLSGGAGGMEFPGLITVGRGLYSGGGEEGALKSLSSALGVDVSGVVTQELQTALAGLLEFTVDHEIAHQYFPMMVGSDPIREPVVDESLAQYVALLVFEWRHGPEAAEALRQQALVASYQFYRMTGGKDGRADRPTSKYHESTEYAALVYGKAPMLHHAWRELLGDDYVRGLRAYVDTYRFRWANASDLPRVLSRISPQQAREIEKLRVRWWEQAHGDEDLGSFDLGGSDLSKLQGADAESLKALEQLLNSQ